MVTAICFLISSSDQNDYHISEKFAVSNGCWLGVNAVQIHIYIIYIYIYIYKEKEKQRKFYAILLC